MNILTIIPMNNVGALTLPSSSICDSKGIQLLAVVDRNYCHQKMI